MSHTHNKKDFLLTCLYQRHSIVHRVTHTEFDRKPFYNGINNHKDHSLTTVYSTDIVIFDIEGDKESGGNLHGKASGR